MDKTGSAAESLTLARKFASEGQYVEAERLFRRALEQCEEQLSERDQTSIECLGCLGDCLHMQGKYSAAEIYFRRALKFAHFAESIGLLERLSLSLLAMGRREDAAGVREQIQRLQSRPRFTGHLCASQIHDRQQLIIIAGAGEDGGDEMALLLASELVRSYELELLAVIGTVHPVIARAALLRGTLDMLDLSTVPVGIGTDGGCQTKTDEFSQFISVGKTGIDYFSGHLESAENVQKAIGTSKELPTSLECNIFEGQKLIKDSLQKAEDKSVSFLLVSSETDLAVFLRQNSDLFRQKVKQVVIMGGARAFEDGVDLEPSDAHNNAMDMAGSRFVYKKCQELQVPMIILSRFAAYACPAQKKVYDLMVRCPVPNPVACRLQRAQMASIEILWKKVCMGDVLPERCDKHWFCNTFCDGNGIDRCIDNSMWDLVKTLHMYAPLALLAAVPDRLEQFFSPEVHFSSSGSQNLILGLHEDTSGIKSKEDLQDFMLTTWIRGAGRPVSPERPVELDAEHLTAALQPMREHSQEEMNELNKNVLHVLNHEWPKYKNSSKLSSWRQRDQLMRSIGPQMLVMDPDMISRLGRIPHSAEERGISLEAAAHLAEKEGKRFFIEMFSHRWFSPYAPDNLHCDKARVLIEWSRYRRSMGLRTFFWIDYVCIDQSDLQPGIAMLPLYVASCNNIVCYDTRPYEPRAWCRVERLMFVSFVAPNVEYVDPEFVYSNELPRNAKGELTPSTEIKKIVPNPSAPDSVLSYPSDMPLIAKLKDLCTQHWAQCWQDGLMDIVEKEGGFTEIRNLNYGVTRIRKRTYANVDKHASSSRRRWRV